MTPQLTDEMVPAELARIDAVFAKQRDHRHALAARDAAARIAVLKRLLTWVQSNQDAILDAAAADFGKPAAEAKLSEIYAVTSEAKHAIKHLRGWMRPKRVRRPLALLTTKGRIHYEPRGVALIIAPWNYPFNLCIGPLVSAIAAGCAACIKPSELTPAMSSVIRRLVDEIFSENEVACFEGDARVAQALLDKPFDHIFFTGSTRIGKLVMGAAAKHLASVTLELGGKSPTIIDETAHIADAVAKIVWGKFINNGQTCIAPDYLLVHQSRAEAFRTALTAEIERAYGKTAEARKQSPDYARIVNDGHFNRLRALLEKSREEGAELIFGGETDEATRYIEPTVLGGVDFDSASMTEEIFGPILPMLTYDDLDAAIAAINAREKPLALYLFTTSSARKRKVLAETTAGGSCINEIAVHYLHHGLPFGGVNQSGIGNAHGYFGFKAFSHERAVLEHHRFSILKMMAPPYGPKARRLIDLTLRWF